MRSVPSVRPLVPVMRERPVRVIDRKDTGANG
jgi:hypothetical protein